MRCGPNFLFKNLLIYMNSDERREQITRFESKLHHFLHYETHNYTKDGRFEIDYEKAEQILYNLTSAYLNNCLEFVIQEPYIIVYQDCYLCGKPKCNLLNLDIVLKEFKRIWRTGY